MSPSKRWATSCALMLVVGAAWSPRAHAQDWFGLATYQISVPEGEMAKFVDDVSYMGAGMDFRKTIVGGLTGSVSMAWNVFHDRTSGVLDLGNGAISGSQDRYINSFPVMIGIHQYFGNWRRSRIHFGVNAGGYLFVQTFRIGVSEFEEDTWEWGVAPEAGITLPIRTGAWLAINGRYHWSPTVESLAGNDAEMTYYQLNIGFMWEQ